jgi:hypothetical protein
MTYQHLFFDKKAISTGVMLNFLSLLLGSILIFFTPIKITVPEKCDYRSKLYLFLVAICTTGSIIAIGDFSRALNGIHPPTGFFIYAGMFFSLDFYILFSLAASPDFLPATQLLYVLKNLATASRSASLNLFLLFIYSSWSANALRLFKRYTVYFLMAFAFSLFSFEFASHYRSGDFEIQIVMAKKDKTSQSPHKIAYIIPKPTFAQKISMSLKINSDLIGRVVGRISYLENTMLPIIHKKNNSETLRIFYEKYSPAHQIKLIINNVVPGDIFSFDVWPNQYYRSAFMNVPVSVSQKEYNSINMTLPVFVYMYSNFFLAIVLAGMIIWFYYLISLAAFRVHPLSGAIFIYSFYGGLLTFFDFVMLSKTLVVSALAIIVFILTGKCEAWFSRLLKFFRRAN